MPFDLFGFTCDRLAQYFSQSEIPILFASPALGHLAFAAFLSLACKIKAMKGKVEETQAVKREKCNFNLLQKG